jgi:hypothetical protein
VVIRRRRQGEQAVMSGQVLFARYSLHSTLVWKDGVDDGQRWTRSRSTANQGQASQRDTATTLATRLVGGAGLAKESAEGHNKETSGPGSVVAVWCYAGSGLVLGVGNGGSGSGE